MRTHQYVRARDALPLHVERQLLENGRTHRAALLIPQRMLRVLRQCADTVFCNEPRWRHELRCEGREHLLQIGKETPGTRQGDLFTHDQGETRPAAPRRNARAHAQPGEQ